jgi:hypothetical protein
MYKNIYCEWNSECFLSRGHPIHEELQFFLIKILNKKFIANKLITKETLLF